MRPGMKKLFIFAVIFLFAWVALRCLLPLFLPFLLGTLIALAAEPGVGFLSRRLKLPRSFSALLGVSAAVLSICALITVACAFLLKELGSAAQALPDLELTAAEGIDVLENGLIALAERAPRSLRPAIEQSVSEFFSGGTALMQQSIRYLLQTAADLLTHIPGSAFGLGTTVISAFLISIRLPQIKAWLLRHFSRERLQQLLNAVKELRSTLGLWIIAQLKLSGISFVVLLVGFLILRVRHALLLALLTAAVDVLPVLGTGAVLLPWSLVCLMQGLTARAVGLLGIYGAVVVIRSVLEPKLVGAQLGLDPLVTLISLYVGFRLWGIGGMLLLPLLTVCTVHFLPGKKQGKY